MLLLFSRRLSVCIWNVQTAMTVHQTKHALMLDVWIPVRYQMCVDSMLIVCLSTMLEFVPVSLGIQETLILVVLLCSIVVQTANVQLVPDVTMGFAHVSINNIETVFISWG
jgi:hypothetical protein